MHLAHWRQAGLALIVAASLTACAQPTPAPTAPPEAAPTTPAPTAPPPAAPTAAPTPAPTSEPPPTPAPAPSWTSWSAANAVYALIPGADELIMGGPGGVIRWGLDGSVRARYTTGTGLPSPVAQGLLLDPDGTLWVATSGGLARFNGAESAAYTRTDGLDSDTVVAVTRVRDELWIGTYYSGVNGGGLMRFVEGTWQSVRGFPSADENQRPGRLSYNVNSIVLDPAGGLWVGTTNGVGRFDGQAWTRYGTAEGLPSNRVTQLLVDRGGQVWAATEGGAARFDGQGFASFRQLQGLAIFGLAQDAAGRFWFAGNGGLTRFNPAVGDWERFDQQANDLPAYTMTRVVALADGTVFFGSDGGGITQLTDARFTNWPVPNGPSFAGLRRIVPAPQAEALLFVEESWIRVDQYSLSAGQWARVPDLPCDGCAPLAVDAAGAVWAGSERGLWVIAPDDVTQWTTAFGLPSDIVNTVAFDGAGGAWVGTGAGLARIEGAAVTEVITDTVGLPTTYIRRVFLASDGALWAATDLSLSRRGPDGVWQHFTAGAPFSYAVPINDLAEAADGAIWVATQGDAVYRYAAGAWTAFQPNDPGVKLPSGYVFAVAVAPDGSLWFGTDAGAARYAEGEWSTVRVQDGLIHPRVLDLHIDASGALWFATGGGVSRYGP